MRVGILGSGSMGIAHAQAFAKLPDVQIVAFSSRSLEKAQKLAAEFGARATTSDSDIINDPSLDAISNTLPTHLHTQYTVAALQAGKHVLLEKPFALNTDDCDTMIAAQKASGRLLMLAHVLRFWPEYEALVGIVKGGTLGKPRAAVAHRIASFPAWGSWFNNPEQSGGAVLDLMVHDFDMLNWLLGTPKSVYARGHEAKPGLWSHIHAEVAYEDAHGFAEGSHLMPDGYPFTCGLKVLCEGGALELAMRAGSDSLLTVYEHERSYHPEIPAGKPFERQAAYFVEAVRENTPPARSDPASARLAIQLSNTARRSLESGRIELLT